MKRNKITIIGAGNVGATCAQRIVERGYADIVLVDVVEGLPQGKARDIRQSAPLLNFDSRVIGTNSYQETASSDVVIITSGIGRKPGMSRDELLNTNVNIVASVTREIVSYSPDCIIIVVTNPVDPMTYVAMQTSKFPPNKVFGLSGALDAARLSSFIATELDVSVENVSACVIGQHGDNMVVIPRLTTVNGISITKILPQKTIDKLVERTVKGGAEIIGLLKTGGAFYAPSAAAARMAEAVTLDKKKIMTCATYLNGEYGIKGAVIGVPVKLGRNGIEQIIELELTPEEKEALTRSANAVRELISAIRLS